MGSIPPAASIEFPQREIVRVISSSGFTPSNTDLQQLARAIQGGAMNYALAGGTPNSISVTLAPEPLAYVAGLMVIVKTTSTPTDQVQIDCNSLGGKAIVSQDGTPIAAGAWSANWLLVLVYDGTRFILVSASATVFGGTVTLTAPRDYYVNVNTGNDANPGITPLLPFKTIQKGCTTVSKLDLNGYTATVHVADGVYPESVSLPAVSINGTAILTGNNVTWANCFINAPAGSPIISGLGTMTWFVRGFKLSSQAASITDPGFGIWMRNSGQSVWYHNIEFGFVPGLASHVSSTGGVAIALGADFGGGGIRISGNAGGHVSAQGGGAIGTYGNLVDLTFVGTPSIGTFAIATNLGIMMQVYNSISGNCYGSKYVAILNGVVNSGGRGASYYPGTVAGTLGTGGQYG